MNTLPNLPIEIIDKINGMAREMEILEMNELNRAVRFNNCMKWIDYMLEEFDDMSLEDDGYNFYTFLQDDNFFD
tara:strand:+ start:770 stop:991 length:222 start_codon:yes stop_codon:yes gene_type:complete